MSYHGGLEYAFLYDDVEIAVRGGGNGSLYNTRGIYGYAAGLGVRYLGYGLNYAFKGDTDPELTLGYSHRIAIIISPRSDAE